MKLYDMIIDKKIIGWGTGEYFKKYSNSIKNRLEYLVDNNSSRWNQVIDEIIIKSPTVLENENMSECVIVVFSMYYDEIESCIYDKYKNAMVIDGYLLDVVLYDDICWNEQLIKVMQHKLQKIKSLNISLASLKCSYGMDSGTQRFVTLQNEVIKNSGKTIIHIIPVQMSIGEKKSFVMLIYNNKLLGIVDFNILKLLEMEIDVFILHTVLEKRCMVEPIMQWVSPKKILCYIHDYSCICMKNHCLYIPQKDSICRTYEELRYNCDACEYYSEESKKFYDLYKKFLNKENTVVITPSENTRHIIKKIFNSKKVIAIPHLKYSVFNEIKEVSNKKLKIAFIGAANVYKGWNNFIKIADKYKDKYEFYCLGRYVGMPIEYIQNVNISASHKDGALDMTEAIKQYNIDIAYLGSVWPETYCYTYFEALQAGVWVLTTEQSGNVKDMVYKYGGGYVAKDTDEILSLLDNEERLRDLIAEVVKIENVYNNTDFLKLL